MSSSIDAAGLLMLVLVALAIPAAAFAAITSGDGTTIANGKATLVSNSVQSDSWVSFDDLNSQAPSALTALSANIVSADGWGGGSPRFQVRVTNGTATHNIFVYFGDAPNFASGTAGDTGNLLNLGALGGPRHAQTVATLRGIVERG